MTQRAYEVFEHTADIALHAFGSAVAAALPLPAFPPRSVQKDDAHPLVSSVLHGCATLLEEDSVTTNSRGQRSS